MKRLLAVLPLLAILASAQEPVPRTYFGMVLHCCGINGTAARVREPWPTAEFGGLRLWDSHTLWLQINPEPGKYDWKDLDSWLDKATEHNEDVMYTFGGIPSWAASQPGDPKCRQWKPGSCSPTSDLREDGSGSNQLFKDFVKAIATRAHGRIKYWEAFNEPMNLFYWNGTVQQLVRMTSDMKEIVKSVDPGAVIVSPGTGWINKRPENGTTAWNALIYTDKYLEAGGNKLVDVVATHAYLKGECPTGMWDLSQVEKRTDELKKIMKRNGVADLPMWSTEGSWGPTSGKENLVCTTDPDMQVAYVGQYHIMMWNAGYKRVYWYAWNDGGTGTLTSQHGEPTAAGNAYGEIIKWMVGATLAGCQQNKDQYQCKFTRPDGSQYLALWDNSQKCGGGNCSTTPLKVDASYVDYLDLSGGKTKIQSNTVPVGLKPIWLEAPPAPAPKKK